METLDLKTKVGPMPDFVRATRPDPATLKFMPIGTPHPARPTPARAPASVEAAKAALDAAAAAQLLPRPPLQLKPAAKLKPAKTPPPVAGE